MTILLVGDYNRTDFLFVAKQFHRKANFFFIEYLNEKEIKNNECFEYGRVLFWKDFSDAYDLLKKVKPDKVVFYFIESYNHIALNVAAKAMKVPTFHLEHGIRFPLSFSKDIVKSASATKNLSPKKKIQKFLLLRDKILNRKFFLNTVKKSVGEAASFLKQYFEIRSKHSILETWQKLNNPMRLPGTYISYSPVIFEFHKELDLLPDSYPVHYIGVPAFDSFCQWKHIKSSEENILFIDQPLHESSLLGWTKQHKLIFLKQLAETVIGQGKILYIKPHPWNDIELYKEISTLEKVVVFDGKWEVVIFRINTVVGFSSTLLLPFMAMDHVCCFTMELHPSSGNLPYSHYLLESGTCHAISDISQLSENIRNRRCFHEQQKVYKEQFTQDWLYKFDGRSTERLKNILLGETS